MQNEQFTQIVSAFAKANKVSRAKVESLVSEIISSMPQRSGKSGGRPMNPATMQLRQDVLAALQKGHPSTKAIKEAINWQGSEAYINNALLFWQQEGKAKMTGKDTSKVGKGRKPSLWTATA